MFPLMDYHDEGRVQGIDQLLQKQSQQPWSRREGVQTRW